MGRAPAEPVGRGPEWLGRAGEAGEEVPDIGRFSSSVGRQEPASQARGIRAFARAEASVAAASEAGTDRTTARLGNWPQARQALRDDDAGNAASLALEADRLVG